MKERITVIILILGITLSFLPCSALAGAKFPIGTDKVEKWISQDRYVTYPLLKARDPALREVIAKINKQIEETAHTADYIALLSGLKASDSTLTMNYDMLTSEGFMNGRGYISILINVQGQMQSDPPAQADYPMTFNLASGERVLFEELFIDSAGAKAYIEEALRSSISQDLADCFENNQLLPVPYQQFALSGHGHITFYYDKDQLSFKSGAPGAVSFRFSELWDYLDTSSSGIPMSFMNTGFGTPQYPKVHGVLLDYKEVINAAAHLGDIAGIDNYVPSVGSTLEHAFRWWSPVGNAATYPAGGYFYRLETPQSRGTLLLTDEAKSMITGLLTSRVDSYGIETGKTLLAEAMSLVGLPATEFPVSQTDAQRLLVCEGSAAAYRFTDATVIDSYTLSTLSLTLYADMDGIVQYIKLAIENT